MTTQQVSPEDASQVTREVRTPGAASLLQATSSSAPPPAAVKTAVNLAVAQTPDGAAPVPVPQPEPVPQPNPASLLVELPQTAGRPRG